MVQSPGNSKMGLIIAQRLPKTSSIPSSHLKEMDQSLKTTKRTTMVSLQHNRDHFQQLHKVNHSLIHSVMFVEKVTVEEMRSWIDTEPLIIKIQFLNETLDHKDTTRMPPLQIESKGLFQLWKVLIRWKWREAIAWVETHTTIHKTLWILQLRSSYSAFQGDSVNLLSQIKCKYDCLNLNRFVIWCYVTLEKRTSIICYTQALRWLRPIRRKRQASVLVLSYHKRTCQSMKDQDLGQPLTQ